MLSGPLERIGDRGLLFSPFRCPPDSVRPYTIGIEMDHSRLRALDGLRGIAALIVLVHHSLLVVPALAAPYFGQVDIGGWAGLLVNTPLHLLWAGTEAVYLFFILSGLVLAFSVKSASFSWSSYFPSRFARLYLPVFGAVVLGAIVIWATPTFDAADSLWVRNRPEQYELRQLLADLTLLGGPSNAITPLWSLQLELLFSALLPLYIYASRRVTPVLQIAVYLALATLGAYAAVSSLTYLPMFGIGVALASLWPRISSGLSRLPARFSALGWSLALIAAVLMTTSHWMLRPVLPMELAGAVTLPIVLVGICVIIVAAVHAPLLRALLSSRPFAFLGLISFSLYLIHEPIVVALSQMVAAPIVTVFIAVPVCIAVATVFWYVVERPSHRLSRRIRAGVESELRLAAYLSTAPTRGDSVAASSQPRIASTKGSASVAPASRR